MENIITVLKPTVVFVKRAYSDLFRLFKNPIEYQILVVIKHSSYID